MEKCRDRTRVATVTACCPEHSDGNDSGGDGGGIPRRQGMLGGCYGDITLFSVLQLPGRRLSTWNPWYVPAALTSCYLVKMCPNCLCANLEYTSLGSVWSFRSGYPILAVFAMYTYFMYFRRFLYKEYISFISKDLNMYIIKKFLTFIKIINICATWKSCNYLTIYFCYSKDSNFSIKSISINLM